MKTKEKTIYMRRARIEKMLRNYYAQFYFGIDTEKIVFAQTPSFNSRDSKHNFRGVQELRARSGLQFGVLDSLQREKIYAYKITGIGEFNRV